MKFVDFFQLASCSHWQLTQELEDCCNNYTLPVHWDIAAGPAPQIRLSTLLVRAMVSLPYRILGF